MYDIYFKYADGNDIFCPGIQKIEIESSNGYITLSGEQLLTSRVRIHGTIYLFSETSNTAINSSGLLQIQIKKK